MEDLLNGLKAAAEPTRLRILALCAQGELSVTDLTQILGQSQPRVSRHLKLLGDAGLLDRFREGTFAYFRLAEGGAGGELARKLADLVPESDATHRLDLERLETIKRQRADAAAVYFAENAASWDEIRRLHIADSEVEQALIDRMPARAGALLDLGTGTARMMALAADRFERAVGIDLSREMLSVARANLDRAGLSRCQVRQGNLYQLPVPTASFDVAVMHQVLHYLETPAAALAEAARALRPGGRLLIADFARHDVEALRREHAHRWMGFGDEEVAGWLTRAGFDVEPVQHLPGAPLTVTLWAAVRRPAVTATPYEAQRSVGEG